MEKRSVARELAFLALFQLPKNPDKLVKTDFQALILSAIRTLSDYSKDNIKKAESFFIQTERYLMEHQLNHPDNEELEVAIRGVEVPKTDKFTEHLDNCYNAISLLKEALTIPETYWHFHDEVTSAFALDLILNYMQHRETIKTTVAELSSKWDIERMRKTDRILIEFAASEVLHSDTPNAVVASETLKLANKYSNEEGVKFINGILADVIEKVTT